jgi:calcineurin-like phosphoesterase family protein
VVHGHVHQPWKVRGRGIHVGLDAWDLRPVPRGTLEKLIVAEFGPAGQEAA